MKSFFMGVALGAFLIFILFTWMLLQAPLEPKLTFTYDTCPAAQAALACPLDAGCEISVD
jgi:hypothetical protein